MINLFTYALSKRGAAASSSASEVDLSDYAKKSELDDYALKTMLDEYAKKDEVKAYVPFPEGWIEVAQDRDKTIKDLCDVIKNDPLAIGGRVFLGGIRCGLSGINGLANADAVVEIISGNTPSTKVIHIVMTSGSIAPYRWEYTYWNGGNSHTSDWVSWELA